MNLAVIEMENIVVLAGRAPVLQIGTFFVNRGEFVALMGANGAGKTTLLRACLGLQKLAQGRVRMLGQDLAQLGYMELTWLRRRIGYVPQLLPGQGEMPLTVREVVAIGRTGRAGFLRPLRKQDWQRVDEWIERLGLGGLGRRAFKELSGGEQRKAIIARAMVQEPELLLLDEPTANLDLAWRERIVETIDALSRQREFTVVLVCHDLEVLPPAGHRVVLLDRGRVMAEGNPEEVFTSKRVTALYGPGLAVVHEGGRHSIIPRGGSS